MRDNILIIIFVLSLFLIGCNEVIDFSNEDAQRQPWLFSFIKDYEVLEGKHNLQTGIVNIYLKINNDSLFFKNSDSIASDGKWETGYFSREKRVYVKNIPFQGGEENIVIIKVSQIKSNLVEFTVY